MRTKDLKINPKNPRIIKDEKFEKLCNSIREFPKMMELRPIVIDANGVILGGNMRYKAITHIGMKEIPDEWVKRAETLTEEEKERFIVADNVSGGEWDFDALRENWDIDTLENWGIDLEDEQPFNTNGDGAVENLSYLRFGKRKIPISDEEIALLDEELQKYLEENSVTYGFVTKIVQCLKG